MTRNINSRADLSSTGDNNNHCIRSLKDPQARLYVNFDAYRQTVQQASAMTLNNVKLEPGLLLPLLDVKRLTPLDSTWGMDSYAFKVDINKWMGLTYNLICSKLVDSVRNLDLIVDESWLPH